jgi:hypothetical protein
VTPRGAVGASSTRRVSPARECPSATPAPVRPDQASRRAMESALLQRAATYGFDCKPWRLEGTFDPFDFGTLGMDRSFPQGDYGPFFDGEYGVNVHVGPVDEYEATAGAFASAVLVVDDFGTVPGIDEATPSPPHRGQRAGPARGRRPACHRTGSARMLTMPARGRRQPTPPSRPMAHSIEGCVSRCGRGCTVRRRQGGGR